MFLKLCTEIIQCFIRFRVNYQTLLKFNLRFALYISHIYSGLIYCMSHTCENYIPIKKILLLIISERKLINAYKTFGKLSEN